MAIQKAIEIIYDLLFIGKTAAKDIQISKDANTARKIKKAVLDEDIDKLRRVIAKGGIFIDETDIMGFQIIEGVPFVIVTAEFIVAYRQMFKDIVRYKRAKGN